MKKTLLLSAAMLIGLFATNAVATPLSYWTTNDDANFLVRDSDAKIEFGYYFVDDIFAPDVTTVDLTTLFAAGVAPLSNALIQHPATPPNFGFYVLNTANDNIWLSDASISGPVASGELLGLNIQQASSDRFMITPLVTIPDANDDWIFTFLRDDGTTMRWEGQGDDLNPVPEPATMLLFGTGLIGLAGIARKKRMKK